MSLTASMWTGVSGLISHGERMNVIGNNIANVNTVGFKGQRMDFEDFIYQNSYSSAGITQIGRGVGIGAVMGDFAQGSFETTTEGTDLAIGGRGFFKVKPNGSDTEYFTRAGNFRFNKEGYLNDPNSYTLQGWKIDNTAGPVRASNGMAPDTNVAQIKGTGVPTDVRLDTWTVEPLQTTKVSFNMNLSSNKGADNARDPNNPFAALLNTWDGTQPPKPNNPYLPESSFSGSPATIKVFDEAGATHTLTIYFDQVADSSYAGGGNGEKMWEYVVTMDPAEDMRQIAMPKDPAAYLASQQPGGLPYTGGFDVTDMKNTKQAGVLMSGTLTFDSAGKLKNQSAYVVNGNKKPVTTGLPPSLVAGNGYTLDADGNPVPILDPKDPANYMYPTEVSSSGFPMVVPNFTGIPGANSVGSVPDADVYLMEIDFGLKVSDYTAPWNNMNSLGSMTFQNVNNPISNTWGAGTAGEAGYVPNPAAPTNPQLSAGSIVGNGNGVPAYYFENPDYNPMVDGSMPYIYDTAGSYRTAYLQAKKTSMDRVTDIGNPMTTWTTNPVITPTPSSALLGKANVVANTTAGATPAYYYKNPDYVTGTVGGNVPPYVYADAAAYNAAYTQALANAAGVAANITEANWPVPGTTVGANTFNGLAVTEPAMVKSDWPKTGLMAATPPSASGIADIKPPAYRQANAFTSFTGADNAVKSASQNGYGFGDLNTWTVSTDGVLSGIYSNGVTLPLYQIALYDFTCKQGLRREGSNLFSQTLESGDPASATAGSSGFGTINAQMLEGSNVDLSREFVQMITTQRGFQSNSKVVTTVDQMLETVMGMKR